MEDVQIILSALWVATMLTFLWGDVLSIIAGDVKKMFGEQVQMTQSMWVAIAILMLIPIVMIVLSLTLNYPLNRWANIIAAIFWFGFNLLSLRGYPTYEKILLLVSMGFNVLTVWYAWKWV
ncbi:MAG: hypothetical protein JSV20_07990 [Candidatus Bathyarchaeota archaeon]|nr:MAG: hypothetical protein JSV20_07990 [Candidatus Bathyarchaeota archaeon]